MDKGSVENTATATGTDPNGDPVSNKGEATVNMVAAAPALTVEKKADKTEGAALGEEITYTITVTNTGNVTVKDITVNDPQTGLNQSVGNLAPGGSETVTTKHTITEADILARSYVNTATATGKDPKGNLVTNTDSVTVTPVAKNAALTVEKTADKNSGVNLGETVTYTITVTNNGNVTVSDITVNDSKTGLNQNVGALAPGASTSVNTTHTISQADMDAGKVENTATATGKDPNSVNVTTSGSVTVTTVEQAPGLKVEKKANKTSGAALGEEISYTITVTNSGNVTVSGITVTDLQTGLNQSVGALAPGESAEDITTTYTVTEADILTGKIENTATAKGKDPNGEEVTGSDDVTVTTVDAAPALTVVKAANKTEGAALNEEITYTITVTNSGNVTVKDITVNDPLTGLEKSVGTLVPGAGAEAITTTHTVTEADILTGKIENTATATGKDPNGDEVTGSGGATVTTVEAAPALTVVKTADKTSGAALGEEISYTITVTNSGNVTVSDIIVTDPLTELNQNVGTLAPGASAEAITTTHAITEADILAGSFKNTATATGTDPKGGKVTGSDDETVTTVEAAPALTVVKTADKTSGAELNDVITYTITVTNSGNVTVSDITVNDKQTGLEESAGTLAPKASTSVTTTHAITEADIKAGSFVNTATAAGTDPNGGKVTGSDDETVTTVEQKPALTVVKTADKTSDAALGEEITYTITVTNSGNVTVSDITVTDEQTGLEESAGTLAPKASTSVTTTHTITEDDILAGRFVNTATATGTDLDGKEVTGSDEVTVTTTAQNPAWTVAKSMSGATGAGGKAVVGDALTYTITITNTGNVTLNDLTVSDELNGAPVDLSGAKLDKPEDSSATFADGKLSGVGVGEMVTLTYTYTVKATDNNLNNTAKVGDQTDTETTEVEDKDAWTVEKTVEGATGADGKAVVGDVLTYTVTVQNTGNTDLSGLKLEDEFSVDGVVNNDALTWTEGNPAEAFGLAQGATKTFKATYTVQATDNRLNNTATVGEQTDTETTEVEDKDAWTVEKTVEGANGADGKAVVGDELTYTVTVTNTGNTDMSGLTLEDEFSVDGVVKNDALTWTEGNPAEAFNLAQGATKTFTATYTVQATDNNLSNTAKTDDDHSTTISTPVEDKDAWTVTKTVSGAKGTDGKAVVGDELTYTVTVANTGNTDLTDLKLEDNFTVDEVVQNDALAWAEGSDPTQAFDLKQGETKTFTATYTVQASDNSLSNAAKTDDDHSTTISTPVEDKDAWTVTKTVSGAKGTDGKAVVGDELTYTVTVENTGNTDLSGLKLEDEFSVDGVVNNEALAWTEGNPAEAFGLAQGETKTFKATYTVQATDNNLNNSAKVGGETATIPTAVEDKDAWTVEKTVSGATGADGRAVVGDELTYTVTVENTGNTGLSGLKLEDNFSVDGVVNNGALAWTEGNLADAFDLAQGEKKEFTATYTVQATDNSLSNTATVNDVSSTSVTTSVVGKDAWTVEKTVSGATGEDGKAVVGDKLTYTVTVENTGNTDLSGLKLEDEFSVDGVEKNDALTWAEGSDPTQAFELKQGATKTFTATYTVQATDSNLSNTATVGEQTDTETTEVEDKDAWTVEKTVEGATGADGKAEVGDELTYTVTVKNTGNTDLSGLKLEDEFSVDGVAKNDALTWTEGSAPTRAFDLDKGNTKTFTAAYTVQATDKNLGNTANVGGQKATISTPVVPKEAYEASKTVTGATGADGKAVVGDALTYTITIVNAGNTELSVELKDILNGKEYDLSEAKISGGALKGSALTVAYGETATITYSYTVQPADVELNNSITVDGKKPDGGDVDTAVTVVPTPAYEVSKTVSGLITEGENVGKAAVGSTLTYTITVKNTGNTVLNDLVIEDTFKGVGKPGAWTLNANKGSEAKLDEKTLSGLAIGETVTITYMYTVQPSDATISNTVTVNGNDGGKTTTTVEEKPGLTATKTLKNEGTGEGGAFKANETATFDIVVENTGNTTQNDVVVTDTMAGAKIIAGDGYTLNADGTATIPTIAVGESVTVKAEYAVTQTDIDNQTELENTATVKGEGTTTGPDPAPIPTEDKNPGLTTTKTLTNEGTGEDGAFKANETATFDIVVENTGNTTQHDVAVTEGMTGAKFVNGDGYTVNADGTATIPTIEVGESVTVKAEYAVTQVDIDKQTELANTATVEGEGSTPNPDPEPIPTEDKNPGLTTSKTLTNEGTGESGAFKANETATFDIVVENTGNTTQNDVVVTDTMAGAKIAAGDGYTLNADGTATIPTIEVGESVTVKAEYAVTQDDIDKQTELANTATVEGEGTTTGPDPAPIPTEDKAPSLTTSKTLTNEGTGEDGAFKANETATFDIVVENTGNTTQGNVVVTEGMDGAKIVAGDGYTVNEDGTATIGEIPVGESVTVKAEYAVTQTDIDKQTELANTATVEGEGTATGPDPVSIWIEERVPAMTVVKTADKTSGAALGEEITYTITVTNSGNVTVSGITVTDPLTGLNQSAGTLAPKASTSVTTAHTITEDDILAGSFINTATATGTDPNGEEVSGSDGETVKTVEQAPALTVTKSASKNSGDELGETITYTITVTNSGNVTVSDITVTDPLTGLNQSVGTLAPKASTSVTTTHKTTEDDILAGMIENIATATGTGPRGGEVTGSGRAIVRTVAAAPELTVEMSADKTSGANLNDVITYTITVTNSGNETVNHITVTDSLTGIEKSIGTLSPGESASVTTTHTISEADILAGSFVNTATAAGTDPKDGEVTDSDDETVTTAAQAPALKVEKTADKIEGVDLNDVITYTIKVTNSGNVTVSGIAVTDPLTGFEESVGTLAPGASAEAITTTYTVTEADILAGSFENTATAAGTDPNGKPVTESDDETVTTVAQNPAWTVEKSVSGAKGAAGKAVVGDELTYKIAIKNTGNVTLANLKVTDAFSGNHGTPGAMKVTSDKAGAVPALSGGALCLNWPWARR